MRESDDRTSNSPPVRGTAHGRHTFVWLILSVVVVLIAVGAMWIRYSNNATSTVDPKKTPAQSTP